jgi:hypothetical protein
MIVPPTTFRILSPTPPVNHRFTGLPAISQICELVTFVVPRPRRHARRRPGRPGWRAARRTGAAHHRGGPAICGTPSATPPVTHASALCDSWPCPPRSSGRPLPVALGNEEGRGFFSKAHVQNVIRRSHGAAAPTLHAYRHLAPRQYRQRSRSPLEAHPAPQHLVIDIGCRRPHAPPVDRSQSPGGQPAPETPGCTCGAWPTYGLHL